MVFTLSTKHLVIFFNSMKLAHNKTIWIIDDTVPSDVFSAEPTMERCYRLRQAMGGDDWAWMGDVYKTIFLIERLLPFFHFRTFTGHGQTVIWREAEARTFAADPLTLEHVGSMSYIDMISRREAMRFESDEKIFQAIERAMKTA